MQRDEVCKVFFEDNKRVADILNMYTGEYKVSADDIQEANSGLIFKIRETFGRRDVSKIRDIVRKVAFGTTFIIADIEPQDNVDYSYPLRDLCYIYGEYEKQARSIRRYIRKHHKGLSAGEILYSFARDSRLSPTVILLLYSGEKEWDGPTELWQMLDMNDIPDNLKKMIMNHKIHMIDIRRLSDEILNGFETDISKVFKSIICSNDKNSFNQLISNDEYFTDMAEDAFDLVSAYININKPINKDTIRNQNGGYNMCKAIDDMMKDSFDAGISQGISQGKEIVLLALISQGTISIENAAEQMNMSPQEFAGKYHCKIDK